MNDETRQIREQLLDRIVLGLAIIGLVTALTTLAIRGMSSPWFFRAIALFIVSLVAFGLRRVSQLVVAALVLVLELLGIVAGTLLQTNVTGFTTYLFIPIIIITGLILSPTATIIVGLLSLLIIVVIVVLTQPLSLATLVALVPPFSLIILASLLIIETRRYVEKLGERLVESRKLLRERTLEMMEAQERIAELQEKGEDLKQQLLTSQGEMHQAHQAAIQKSQGLYELMKGSIQELDTSVENLERVIDQISETPSPEEQANLLEQVWQKVYHLNNLVVNLENMAQLKNERITLNYQAVDIAPLINDIAGTTRGLVRRKNVEIRCQIPDNLPKVELDPVRIRQALLYVLNNAVKYTDQGIIEIQVELNAKELLIFVSDTGIGMHREEMELIFQEFGRGSGTLAKQRQGTGLGLAISKGLVELHGGRMWVTSVLGVGSTFYINLPLKPPVSKVLPTTSAPIPESAAVEAPDSLLDEEETILSPPSTTKTPPPTKVGSPVGRFSPTYIGRFGYILLGLLLIIASCVALLAAFYGPVGDKEIAAVESLTPTQGAGDSLATKTRQTEESFALAASDTPPATPPPTVTSSPTGTPTVPPTETPSPTPTNTSVVPASPTNTSTPTQAPPSPTSTSTPAPPQPPSPTPTNTAQPVTAATVSAAPAPPTVTRPRARGLSFVSDQTGSQLVAFHPLGDTSSSSLDKAGGIVGNSNLSWSPSGDRVLFTTKRDGNYEIYVANADGSEPFNLTRSTGYDTQPAWSPDGQKIAFSSQRDGNVDIYVMDADGRNLQQLTTGRGYEEWAVWSPDGRQIAFVSDEHGNIEIYTMNADGSNLQQVTDNPADDWPAVWSPDSQRILFSSNRDGNWNLYVINADGSNPQRLTNASADEREPVWSPDGGTIAFAYNGDGNWDIYTIPAPPRTFTEIPKIAWTQFTNTPTNERYPAWSP